MRKISPYVGLLVVAWGGCGEVRVSFDPPAPPCRYGSAFLTGRVEEIGGGCVSVRVERIVAEPDNGEPEALEVGAVVRGKLSTIYAYTHDFAADDSVALFVQTYDGEALTLQLFPFENERVQVQWATASLSLELEEMSADDCPQQLQDRRPQQRDTRSGGGPTSAAPPPEEVTCSNP